MEECEDINLELSISIHPTSSSHDIGWISGHIMFINMSFFTWCARFVPPNFQPFFGLPIKWWHMPWEFIMERYFGIPIHLGEMGQVFIPPKWWKHPKPAAILKRSPRSHFAPPMTFIYQNNLNFFNSVRNLCKVRV